MTIRSQILIVTILCSLNLLSQNRDSIQTAGDTTAIPYSDTSFVSVSQRAEQYQRDNNYSGAKAEYLKIRYYHSNNPAIIRFSDYAIALMTLQEGAVTNNTVKRTEAKSLFEKYVKNNPKDERTPRARLTLANIYIEEKKVSDAFNALSAVSQATMPSFVSDSDSLKERDDKLTLYIQSMLSKAQIYIGEKNTSSALAVYDEILSVLKNQPDALLGKAIALSNIGQTKEALQILSELRAKNSSIQEYADQYYRELLERGE